MRSALVGLLESLPSQERVEAVRRYLKHLDHVIEASPFDLEDQRMARQEDRQGIGLSRRATRHGLSLIGCWTPRTPADAPAGRTDRWRGGNGRQRSLALTSPDVVSCNWRCLQIRDLRFPLALPSALALITENPTPAPNLNPRTQPLFDPRGSP